MFTDYVKIFIKAGDGGNGAISFRREPARAGKYLALCVPGTDDRKLRNLCHCMAAGDKEVFLVHSVCQQECVPVVVADLGSGDLS